MLILLLGQSNGEWPRVALTQPHADFLGWRSDTAWVRETVIYDLAALVEEELLIVTAAGPESAPSPLPDSIEPGTEVAGMSSILDGSALYTLRVVASEEDLQHMAEACMNFQDHLDGEPPAVAVRMALVTARDCTEVWSGNRRLTWFGGECAPIFDLPVLDEAVLSPDSSLVFFSVLYGPSMEYFLVPSGI